MHGVLRMAAGGTPFDDCADDQVLPNWATSNGSLEDRLNNMVRLNVLALCVFDHRIINKHFIFL